MLSTRALRAAPLCCCSGPTDSNARLCKLVLRNKLSFTSAYLRPERNGCLWLQRQSTCRATASAAATPSLPGPRRQKRHAMMSDYLVTIPYGMLMTLGGLLSLPLQGSWTGVAVALAGGLLFTIGSMSHDRTTAGQDSKAPLTLAAAGIAAALSRVFYDRAVIGVFGTMAATIVSAAVSLFLVYNVVLGGNKPQQKSSSPFSSAKSSKAKMSSTTTDDHTPAEPAWWEDTSTSQESQRHQDAAQHAESEQAQTLQTTQVAGSAWTQYPANVQLVAVATGLVLYAQGIWGLWGETLGYSPASMTGALASGLIMIGLAQTLSKRQSKHDQSTDGQ